MVTLTLRVDRTANDVRLVFHHGAVDVGDLGPALAAVAAGTYVQVDCEYVAGLGLRAQKILAVTAYSQPSPRTSIRALVEKREYERALAALAAVGEDEVRGDATLLIARASARIGAGDLEGSTTDLRLLLAAPGVTSLDVRDVFEQFSRRFAESATVPLANDLLTWLEVRRPVRATAYLSGLPAKLWPLDLLLTGLEEAVAALEPDKEKVREFLDAARSSAPQDARVLSLWSLAASKGLTAGRGTEPPNG